MDTSVIGRARAWIALATWLSACGSPAEVALDGRVATPDAFTPRDAIVTDCNDLAPIGTWEQIVPANINLALPENGVLMVQTDPNNPGTVYMSGDRQGLFRSTDCGATWMKLDTGRNAEALDSGSQWVFAIDPVDRVFYAGNLYGMNPTLFRSTNEGVDWDPVFTADSEVARRVRGNFFQALSIDRNDHAHLLVSFHDQCRRSPDSGDYDYMCLAESTDAGENWRIFDGPIPMWGEGGGPIPLSATEMLYHTPADGLFYSGNSGATWEEVAGQGGFAIYYAQDGYGYMPTSRGILRSLDGHEWLTIDGAPQGATLVGDGERMFTAWPLPDHGGWRFYTAPETDGTAWTVLTDAPTVPSRVVTFSYDSVHHVLYSADANDGLHRMVTR